LTTDDTHASNHRTPPPIRSLKEQDGMSSVMMNPLVRIEATRVRDVEVPKWQLHPRLRTSAVHEILWPAIPSFDESNLLMASSLSWLPIAPVGSVDIQRFASVRS
jgi:hypothetical protein